jgi:HEAT repeat protein
LWLFYKSDRKVFTIFHLSNDNAENMQSTRQVLNVFLASPGDLTGEREAAEEVISSINRSVGRLLNWNIDLHRWEETLPGTGRPQAKINPMVDKCDLFIGLLWERWGQPSGEYSSGFEEEFERARARYRTEKTPEIWLVFKDIDSKLLTDPGVHVKKILEFRQSQESLREVLFQTVKDTEDWKFKLQGWLTTHLVLLSATQLSEHQPAAAVPTFNSPDLPAVEAASGEIDLRLAPKQLQDIFTLLNCTLKDGKLEFSSSSENPLQEFDVVRCFLFFETLMAHRYTSDVLGTHEINLLYKHRQQLNLTSPEEYQLLRSFVSDRSDVKPGWFWSHESTEDILLFLAFRDSSDDVRIRALELLADARIKISEDSWQFLPLNHNSWHVREAAVRYLANMGDEHAISFLNQFMKEDDLLLNSAIEEAKLNIAMRLEPTKTISKMLGKEEDLSDEQMHLLKGHITKADDGSLLRGMRNPSDKVRKLSLRELIRRASNLEISAVQNWAEKDPSRDVRAVAFEWLAKNGKLPNLKIVKEALKEDEPKSNLGNLRLLLGGFRSEEPDVDSITLSFHRTQSTKELLEEVDWFSPDGRLAYRVLALDRFDVIGDALRSDLKDGFNRIREESVARLKAKFGEKDGGTIAEGWRELDDYIRSKFTESALLGLAENASAQDAFLARPYLEDANSSLRDAAVAVISKIGDSGDVAALLKLSKEAYGTARTQAASAALRLSKDPLETARALLGTNISEVLKITFNWLFQQDSEGVRRLFEDLIDSEDDTNRLRGLYYILKRLSSEKLEEFLIKYTARESYYYNIVIWVDRVLYAPVPLKNLFVQQLERKAQQ